MGERSMKVAKWTDWLNLIERRGKWEHWMVGPSPDQVRYGFWLDTTTDAKWDDRGFQPSEGET